MLDQLKDAIKNKQIAAAFQIYAEMKSSSEEAYAYDIPSYVKEAIIENQNAFVNIYLKNYQSNDPIPFDPNDPVVMTLKWHTSLDLPKGELNRSRMNLCEIYGATKDPKNLEAMGKIIQDCSFLDVDCITNMYTDLLSMDKPDPDSVYNEHLLNILLKTSPNQRFTGNEDRLKSLKSKRAQLAEEYFQHKRFFTKQDLILLSDVSILANLEDKEQIIQKVLHDIKNNNPTYYKDKSTWLPILLSADQTEIDKLTNHVMSQSAYDMSYLSRQYTKIILKKLDTSKNDENRARRDQCLIAAAIRGDKFAFGKFNKVEENKDKKEIVNFVAGKTDELDTYIAYLTEDLFYKNKWETTKKKQLEDKIKEAQDSKEKMLNHADGWFKNGVSTTTEFRSQIEALTLPLTKELTQLERKRKRSNTFRHIATLGISLLTDAAEKIASNFLSGTEVRAGSGYKFWDENFFCAVEAMEDLPKAASAMAKKERLSKKEAEEKLEKINDRINELKSNKKEKQQLAKLEKEQANLKKTIYRHGRNAVNLSNTSFFSDKYPGLEIEERTVLTRDGKQIDILVINNKAAQQNKAAAVPDIIHFPGKTSFYQLDNRPFEHAVSKGCNLVVVHNRLKSTNGHADSASKRDITEDGVAAVKYIMNMRQQEAAASGLNPQTIPPPVIHGYCGGGPIALYTHERLRKEGLNLKFIADRTFHSTSALGKRLVEDDVSNKVAQRFVKFLVKPALQLCGWESDNIKRIKEIPEDQLFYFDVNLNKEKSELYFEDDFIGKSRIHTGLKGERDKKIKKIDEMIHKTNEFIKKLPSQENYENINKKCTELLSALEFLKSSFDMSQVKSKVEEAHATDTSHLLTRDNKPLDNTLQSFIHGANEKSKEYFSPLSIDVKDEKLKNEITNFWMTCGNFYQDFYAHGKKLAGLHLREQDIRIRINDVFGAMNHDLKEKRPAQKSDEKAYKPAPLLISPAHKTVPEEMVTSSLKGEKIEPSQEKKGNQVKNR